MSPGLEAAVIGAAVLGAASAVAGLVVWAVGRLRPPLADVSAAVLAVPAEWLDPTVPAQGTVGIPRAVAALAAADGAAARERVRLSVAAPTVATAQVVARGRAHITAGWPR